MPVSHEAQEECIAHIIDAIIAEGMTVQEFIAAANPSTRVVPSNQRPTSRGIYAARCLNAIRVVQREGFTIYDLFLGVLEIPELRPHARSFSGTGNYSCSVLRRVFKGIRDLVHLAGNEKGIWYDLIQEEANELHINDLGAFPSVPTA
ncbi:hypothetical protein DFH28DRAFT_924572 [Melampsora americana]|nr:hypothetical protein DFH28DRAFT_924572 [Melampsora americana]